MLTDFESASNLFVPVAYKTLQGGKGGLYAFHCSEYQIVRIHTLITVDSNILFFTFYAEHIVGLLSLIFQLYTTVLLRGFSAIFKGIS